MRDCLDGGMECDEMLLEELVEEGIEELNLFGELDRGG